MKKVIKRFPMFFIVIVSIMVMAQNNNDKKHSPLVQRIEKAIKAKEKKFSQFDVTKGEKRNNSLHSTVVWKLGEAGVDVNFIEFNTEKEAVDYLYNNFINNRFDMANIGRSKLTNLGDEAFITSAMYNKGSKTVSMLIRKGGVLITMTASNTILGKRFAKYFVREIEKRDRGEP
jgi:hypothetical protein